MSIKEEKISTVCWAYALNILSKFFDIVFFFFVVKVLGRDELGVYNTVMAVAAFFYIVLNGGLVESTLREVAEKSVRLIDVVKQAGVYRLIILFVVFLLYMFVYDFQKKFYPNILKYICYGIFYQVLIFGQNLCISKLKASGSQNLGNLFIALDSFFKIFIILIFVQYQTVDLLNLWQIVILSKFSVIFGLVFVAFKEVEFSNSKIQYAKSEYFIHIGQAYFMLIGFFTLAQNRFDWMIIAALMDESSVATYSVANRFYEIVIFVAGISATTIYPWVCKQKNAKTDKSEENKVVFIRKMQLIFGVSTIFISIQSYAYVNEIFWDGRYQEVNDVLKMLLPCLVLAISNMNFYYEILAARKEKLILPVSLASTLSQAVFNLFSVKYFGVNGAVMGMWVLNIINIFLYYLVLNGVNLSFKDLFADLIVKRCFFSIFILIFCVYLPPWCLAVFCFLLFMMLFKNEKIKFIKY